MKIMKLFTGIAVIALCVSLMSGCSEIGSLLSDTNTGNNGYNTDNYDTSGTNIDTTGTNNGGYTIPPLEKVETECADCEGTGIAECFTCHGRGYSDFGAGPINCITCDSTGYVDCIPCAGTGIITSYYDQSGNKVDPTIYYQAWNQTINGGTNDIGGYDTYGGGYSNGGTTKCASCINGYRDCPSCHGTGSLSRTHTAPNYGFDTGNNTYSTSQRCAACRGTGKVPCTLCGGDGYY